MEEMIAETHNAKSPDAHHVYGLWLAERGKFAEALQQALATLAFRPEHPGGLYLAGQAEMSLRHFDKAADYVRQGLKVAPQEYAMYTLMADILLRDNQRDKAIQVLNKGIETIQSKDDQGADRVAPGQPVSRQPPQPGPPERRRRRQRCMTRLRNLRFSPVQLEFLAARLSYADDDWKAARVGFEKVQPKLNGFPQLMKCLDYWIGDCYLQQGNPDQAMAAFRGALEFDKSYFKAHDGIAQIFITQGKLKDAVEEYRHAVAGSPNEPEAWLAYAQTLLLYNLRRTPPAGDADWDNLQQVLEQAQERSPRDGQIRLLMAETLVARGRTDKAAELLDALRESSPRSVVFWTARANLAARQGQVERAKQILDEAQAKLGDRVPIRLARASVALGQHGLRAGDEIQRLAANAKAFSPAERAALWTSLMNALMEIKEFDRAKDLCRQIAREQPRDPLIRYRLFELALVTHNVRDPVASLAELDRVLEELDGIAGRGPLWLYGKAVRLKLEAEAADGKPELLDAAMDYAAQAERMRLRLVAALRPQGRNLPPAQAATRRPSITTCRPPPTAIAMRTSSASSCKCSSSGSVTPRPNR